MLYLKNRFLFFLHTWARLLSAHKKVLNTYYNSYVSLGTIGGCEKLWNDVMWISSLWILKPWVSLIIKVFLCTIFEKSNKVPEFWSHLYLVLSSNSLVPNIFVVCRKISSWKILNFADDKSENDFCGIYGI